MNLLFAASLWKLKTRNQINEPIVQPLMLELVWTSCFAFNRLRFDYSDSELPGL